MTIRYADSGEAYRAGACNIGPEEIAHRRRAGLIGVGIALALGIVLVAVGAPAWLRLLVFLPLAGGFISLEQARRHFCVAFAMQGIRNFGAIGRPEQVTVDADRGTDRRAALVMVGYMSAIAAVITVAFALLPI
jgi:hypothetical protein